MMRRPACLARLTLLALIGLAAPLLSGCAKQDDAAGKVKVVATIFAYYDIARAVGGDKVDAQILLDPNTSPHEYSATPEDKDRINAARLIIKNGLGLDDWPVLKGGKAEVVEIAKFVDAKSNPAEVDITATAPTSGPAPAGESRDEKNEGAGHGHEGHHHDHGPVNPHIWLDPTVQMKATEVVRDALARVDPANKSTYEANAARYVADLKQLDADFAAAAKTFTKKEFVGFHSAYDYLADRYGLEEVAAISEVTGGLTPERVDKVIALLKEKKATVVFAEDAFSKDAANKIVAQTGAALGTLQPLETYRDKSDTYVKLMRENLDQMQKLMK